LRFCKVCWCEAFNGVSNILLREDGQSKEEEDQEGVLSIEFIDPVVYWDMNPADQVVESVTIIITIQESFKSEGDKCSRMDEDDRQDWET